MNRASLWGGKGAEAGLLVTWSQTPAEAWEGVHPDVAFAQLPLAPTRHVSRPEVFKMGSDLPVGARCKETSVSAPAW